MQERYAAMNEKIQAIQEEKWVSPNENKKSGSEIKIKNSMKSFRRITNNSSNYITNIFDHQAAAPILPQDLYRRLEKSAIQKDARLLLA